MAILSPINPAIPRYLRCRAKGVIKKGTRKTVHEQHQRWGCTHCGHTFTHLVTKHSRYPVKVIMEAIGRYNLGYSARQTVCYLKHRVGIRSRKRRSVSGTRITNLLFRKLALIRQLRPRHAGCTPLPCAAVSSD